MPFGSTEGLQLSRSRLYYRPKWVAKERRALKEWVVDSEQVGMAIVPNPSHRRTVDPRWRDWLGTPESVSA